MKIVGLRDEEFVQVDREVAAFVLRLSAAVVAMFAATVRIRIAKADADIPGQAERDGKHGHGLDDRASRFLQCTQDAHRGKVYHNTFCEVKPPGPARDRRKKNVVFRSIDGGKLC